MMIVVRKAQRYPNQQHPVHQYFPYLKNRFRQDGNRDAEEKFIINEETEINVIALVEVDKTVYLRKIAQELQISHESARKILKKHGYKAFKYQLHQHLYADDGDRRVVFCDWLLQNHRGDPNFINFILFSDESRFTNNGMFNKQNTRYWAQQTQHEMREGNFQERFGVNVWTGVVGNRIIGPILFQGHLTGARYLGFLQNEIEEHLNNLPLADLRRIYFQHDGAPPHNAREVLNYLIDQFNNKVIATNGPVRWPARSPDLTVLDFFIWGYVKERVYVTTPATLEILEERIQQKGYRTYESEVVQELGHLHHLAWQTLLLHSLAFGENYTQENLPVLVVKPVHVAGVVNGMQETEYVPEVGGVVMEE
ncbi:hypothetical protein NQ315_002706 [Exocentrus adspersus]|uniref:Transposase n=1 Tax=Exocentrus adspersus TaxID=1586481 RepID=A0AAV8VI48_9CUCU|nr:hypothetical protein NQ315_002706 [Exocentrus adspersus]